MVNKQTILIAGAAGMIGGGAAVALAKRGARVVLLGRRSERLEARADFIRVALSEAKIDCLDADIATLVVDFSDMKRALIEKTTHILKTNQDSIG